MDFKSFIAKEVHPCQLVYLAGRSLTRTHMGMVEAVEKNGDTRVRMCTGEINESHTREDWRPISDPFVRRNVGIGFSRAVSSA